MNESHQSRTETHQEEYYEDGIELIDILLVIWKWKYLIVVGTIVCGLIAAIISFNMRKIYSITMALSPGILSIGEQGNRVYIDSPQNIKDLIDSGIFNNDILKHLKEIKMGNTPVRLAFKVTIPLKSNMIKVEYKTDNIKQGIAIQNRLSKLLLENYSTLVKYFQNEYDIKLKLLNSELTYINSTIQSKKRNLDNIQKRIDELTNESKLIKNKTAELIKERDKLLPENPKENNILSALIYNNTMQQNLQFSNDYQNDMSNYQQQKENELQEIDKFENAKIIKLNKEKKLHTERDNIQNLQILQPPATNLSPISPKPRLNIILSMFAGFLFFIFLSFLLEYLSKYRSSKNYRL